MFSWYKYLIVSLVFSHLGFWSGSLFLIAPFPDLCLLVLFLIDKESNSLTYVTIDSAIELIKQAGVGALMCKCDISDAFKLAGLKPETWPVFGVKWKGLYYSIKDLYLDVVLVQNCLIKSQ